MVVGVLDGLLLVLVGEEEGLVVVEGEGLGLGEGDGDGVGVALAAAAGVEDGPGPGDDGEEESLEESSCRMSSSPKWFWALVKASRATSTIDR